MAQQHLTRQPDRTEGAAGPHKTGNDRADALAVAAKKEADGDRRND